MCYNKDFEKLVPAFMEKLPYFLQRLETFLKGKQWFAGDEITVCDFMMWHQLEQLILLEPTALDNTPLLRDFVERFENLSQLQKYMKSDEFLHWPINNKV